MTNPPAGWYRDPSGAPASRYWDGSAWTAHVAPDAPTAVPLDPLRDLEELRTNGRRAKVALLVAVPIYAVTPALQGRQIRQTRRDLADLSHQLSELDAQPGTNPQVRPVTPVPATGLSSLSSLPTLVVGIVFLMWFHRAVTVAARLHRPAQRTPGWAVGGWFVPVGNFFLPYQSARDIFRPDEVSGRRLVKRWWASYLVATLLNLPLIAIDGFNDRPSVALATAALSLVVWLFAALAATAVIDAAERSLVTEAG